MQVTTVNCGRPLARRQGVSSIQNQQNTRSFHASSSCKAARRQFGLVRCQASSQPEQNRSSDQPNWLSGWALKGTGVAACFAIVPAVELSRGGGGGGGSEGHGGGGDGDGGAGRNPLGEIAAAAESEEEEEEEEGSEEEGSEEEDGEEGEEEEAEEEAAPEEEDDEDTLTLDERQFFCEEIAAEGLPRGPNAPKEEDLFAGLKCQPGFKCTRDELSEDLRQLMSMGLFENVDAKVKPLKKGKSKLVFSFTEKMWPPLQSFRVEPYAGSSVLIPQSEIDRVMQEKTEGPVGLVALTAIRNIVEKWYVNKGYQYAYIRHFDGMEKGHVVAKLVEGRVNKVSAVYVDEDGHPKRGGGEVPDEVILREMPFKTGQVYNLEDARSGLREVFSLGLFENVSINAHQDTKDESKINVEVMVRERPMKTAEIECEWAIAPGDSGRPSLVSIIPGGSLMFEHHNLQKKGRQASLNINAQNFLYPGQDMGYKADYKYPYVFGRDDTKKTAFTVSAFNARRLSGVFTPGPGGEEVPPVFVDRSGAKLMLTETYSRNSKGTLGVVAEQITARDENGAVCTHGTRQLPMGAYAPIGPPTTLSEGGRDQLIFLQGSLTRDTTYYVNGAMLGDRDLFEVDQAVGIGSGMPFFNRHTASLTRFRQLAPIPEGSSAPPPVLVLHGRYGGCIGDMASYDLFMLGGPHSVRGFNIGELAASRSFLEGAVEIRLPVPVLKKQVYGFFEFGTDLGSSKQVRGNPTEFFRRAGSGSSIGAGIKLGSVRAEYTHDRNAHKGSIFLHYGERF